ncbi:hypothetical protein HS1genome_1729 [Sulfodiicoccus acidiphilus]|uniref:Uncharacterized protein n=1 Tax=Sulfodiicoccus acidiphilus TaxID=1670455 RepID=A0A348B588_9CREN|nr:hypothetical protein HS1genome_1729 [Sulfodiicoccus acidiphilus]
MPSFYVGDVVAFSNSTYHLPAPVTLKLPTNSTRGSVRYLLDSLQVLGSGSGLDLGPGIYLVRANYTLQFLVEVVYPQTTSSGWYFSGSLITFPSLIQVNSTVRYSLIGRSTFTVTGPANVTPDYVKQYLVTLSLPNGTLSSWIDQDAVATIPALIQVNSTVRYSLVGPSTFIVTVPAELTPDYVKQYLVTLSLPNGTLSSWIDQDAVATIPALIQVNSTVRYSLIGRSTFTVTGPANVTPDYVKQYLVVIDGNSSWMDQGSTVRLYREVGFPFNVKWVGTYNVSNGRVVNVNGPIVEKAVRVLSLVSLAEVVVPVGGAGGLAYALRRRTRSARTFVGKGELVLVNGVVAVVVEVRREDGRNVYYVDFG